MTRLPRPGELAIVLHTHMPYVEGFGVWPFGEEWLWEAIATSYLPLLDVLDRFEDAAPLTLSLTPVLCDQLADAAAMRRCLRFLTEIRPESHRLDIEELHAAGEPALAAELGRSAAEYAAAAERLASLEREGGGDGDGGGGDAGSGGGGGLLAALGAHATWTSSATHAVLPLLATDEGLSLQLQTGIASHRRRLGEWRGGFWMPECGYGPWLDPHLERAGVRATCVELTDVEGFGVGSTRHLGPLATPDGPVLWPIDRATIALVWGEHGYPSRSPYRDYHRYTTHRHRVLTIDGEPYQREAALAQVRLDAEDFVGRVRERVSEGGVCVCALDTELLGHWWHEGAEWLGAVLDQAARQGLKLTSLDDALERHQPSPADSTPDLGVTSWGQGGDLRTWSGPAVARFAWRARSAELALAAGPRHPPARALRELLALQSSDWAFLDDRRLSGDYPEQRAAGHAEALAAAVRGDAGIEPTLRSLAPELVGWA